MRKISNEDSKAVFFASWRCGLYLVLWLIFFSRTAEAGDSTLAGVGGRLFFDKRLSENGSVACANCHKPDSYFQDSLPLSMGVERKTGTRNAPSLLSAARSTSQFWDGRRNSLEEQSLDPLLNPREHGLQTTDTVLDIVRRDPIYVALFLHASGRQRPQDIQLDDVRHALAAFVRKLSIYQAPFDAYAEKVKVSAISESAERGLKLFQGRGQCSGCHSMDEAPALFSDNQFHSLSVGLQAIAPNLAALTSQLVASRARGDLDSTVLSDEQIAVLGRFVVTLKPSDIGKFRTPSLRNVAMTAPYMHDGSVSTLEEAVEVEVYYRSNEAGRPLILTPAEKADLVEFLKSLTTPLPLVLKQAGLEPAATWKRPSAHPSRH